MNIADDQQPSQAFYDNAFRALVGSADVSEPSGADTSDPLDGYVQRIAGTAFCGAGIDPSVVRFATSRAAHQWGRDENEVDAMIGDRLLRATSVLIAELR